jgi:hypothetical protein
VTAHPYIFSFARAVQAAGFEVVSFLPSDSGEEARIDLRYKRSDRVLFRAWVERKRNARGEQEDYGYVEQVHDPRIGRARLLDWTTLSTRAEICTGSNRPSDPTAPGCLSMPLQATGEGGMRRPRHRSRLRARPTTRLGAPRSMRVMRPSTAGSTAPSPTPASMK